MVCAEAVERAKMSFCSRGGEVEILVAKALKAHIIPQLYRYNANRT